MNSNEILNKYIDLIDKGYCSDCNELNCIDNFPHSKITHAIRELQQENKILKENAENNDKVVDKVNWENMLLKKENQELKSQLKGTTHCFDEEEHEKLKKQLEEYENELEKADSITQSCIFNGKKESEISFRKCLNMLEKHKNQQKEFIEYMNKTIEELECDDVDDEEMKGYLIQRIDIFKEILSKYKEIIGDDK